MKVNFFSEKSKANKISPLLQKKVKKILQNGHYTNNKYAWGDKNYTDNTDYNVFNIGYVGEFNTYRTPLIGSKATRSNPLGGVM